MKRLLFTSFCAVTFIFNACERHPASALVHVEHGEGHGESAHSGHDGKAESHETAAPAAGHAQEKHEDAKSTEKAAPEKPKFFH